MNSSALSGKVLRHQVYQSRLEGVIRSLFPSTRIIANARKEPRIISPETGKYLELDVWLPEFNLAFEYQDPHHYATHWFGNTAVSKVQEIDNIKAKVFAERGGTLIAIPYWWDGTEESLIATIRDYRPDLLIHCKNAALPIALGPQSALSGSNYHVPDVGELMVATIPYNTAFLNTSGGLPMWWVSEKHEGIRACWNPLRNILYSRTGKPLIVSKAFRSNCPNVFLDGEIWFGRGETINFHNQAMWAFTKMIVQDCPDPSIQYIPFEARICFFLLHDVSCQLLTSLAVHLSVNLISQHFSLVQMMGGNEIIAHKSSSVYQHGRSDSMINFKECDDDKAPYIRSTEGSELSTISRTPFGFWTTDEQANVKSFFDSFAHQQQLDPLLPESWYHVTHKDIVQKGGITVLNHYGKSLIKALHATYPDIKLDASKFNKKAQKYWHSKYNQQQFLDKFADVKNFDPLVARNWYHVTSDDLIAQKGRGLLHLYRYSVAKLLLTVYPTIGLEKDKFHRTMKGYWKSDEAAKKFFDELAKDKGFSSDAPDMWYTLTLQDIYRKKGGRQVLDYYSGSLVKALQHLYPKSNLQSDHLASKKKCFRNQVGLHKGCIISGNDP